MNKVMRFLVVLFGGMLTLSACGGVDDDPLAQKEEDDLTKITVGVMPIADLAPFHYAEDSGMFAAEGLELEVVSSSAGASLITSTVAGDIDITYSNFVSFIQGVDQGLPLVAIRENNRSGPQGIYTLKSNDIQNGDDLEGKTVAINSLGNIQELTTRAVLANLPDPVLDINFAELPPPEMEAALEAGNVDAAWLVEPFLTRANDSDSMHRVVDAFTGPTQSIPVAGWLSTGEFVDSQTEVVEAFIRVLDQAMEEMVNDLTLFAETIPTFTEMPDELAQRLQEPSLTPESHLDTLRDLEALMVEFGPLESSVDLTGSIYVSE